MTAEARELYVYTTNHFEKEINKISPNSVAPMIAIRQTVKKAMQKYVTEYCSIDSKLEDVFSENDFAQVCEQIYNDITNN